MDIVELFIDENDEVSGIEAISVVENPAIEENFIALKNQEFKLAEVDKEKRILMGAALIPNKPIYRTNGEQEYYIYFSQATVRKASELFFIKGNQNNSTLEHQLELKGLTAVESWIVESEQDKSRMYDLNVPIGTWMVSMKVNNDDVWKKVKAGEVKGFSIEGYFADKLERPNEPVKDEMKEQELESYSDYPSGVKNNAKKGIELNEKVNNKCATQVGKVRAQQLAQGKPITTETIKRMFSYLSRAQEDYDENDTKACGTISYLLWGGKAGLRWAGAKLKELDLIEEDLKKPCQAGYEMIGTKIKNGKTVPNCVPIKQSKMSKEEIAEAKIEELKQLFSTEKVELANINQLAAMVNQARSEEGDMVNSYLEAKQNSKKGVKSGEKHLKNLKEINNVAMDIKNISKDLGVDVTKIKEWKKAMDFLNGNPQKATEIMINKMKGLL
ncbi:MAG: putative peptidase [Prokaryotic dsDNA virus sp.]|nr:MAG: putative peptidase [Prokaryotic dsDNA virus sp.]|tara:strand:+ start:28836 stop:30164 length:1329 start_codon:yes stop_codon:yes gene_type:complete